MHKKKLLLAQLASLDKQSKFGEHTPKHLNEIAIERQLPVCAPVTEVLVKTLDWKQEQYVYLASNSSKSSSEDQRVSPLVSQRSQDVVTNTQKDLEALKVQPQKKHAKLSFKTSSVQDYEPKANVQDEKFFKCTS